MEFKGVVRMDKRKKLRYWLIALGYLGGGILILIPNTVDTGIALLFSWMLLINLLGWYMNRRLRKRQEEMAETGAGENPTPGKNNKLSGSDASTG